MLFLKNKLLPCLFILLFLFSCGEDNTTKDEISDSTSKSETSIQEESETKSSIPAITDEDVKNLFNDIIKAERYVRGYAPQEEQTEDGVPCTPLRDDINTPETLKAYLSKYYSDKAVKEYIENLSTCVLSNGKLGRVSLYFYSQFYPFDSQQQTDVKLLKEEGNLKVYELTVVSGMFDEESKKFDSNKEKSSLKNFQIVFENNQWKLNVMHDKMSE